MSSSRRPRLKKSITLVELKKRFGLCRSGALFRWVVAFESVVQRDLSHSCRCAEDTQYHSQVESNDELENKTLAKVIKTPESGAIRRACVIREAKDR